MKAHSSRESRTCFYHLRRLRSIQRCLGREVTARLVSALIISRLDYCNAILANLPASTLAPLQRVPNAAARLVMNLGPRDHVTPANVIGGRSPPYISELVTPVAAIPGHASLRSVGRQELDVSRTRLVSSERVFEVAAPKAWNKLPVDI